MSTERARNQQAYQALKSKLAEKYQGRFVVIAEGKIVADGTSFEEAINKAEKIAPNVSQRIVFKVGEKYPQILTIGGPIVKA